MSKIEWCDETINPIIGCSKKSIGCQNCYAEKMAVRLQAMGIRGYENVVKDGKWTGKLSFIESELEKPFKWKKPKRIFVGSMTDLFGDDVPFDWIDKVLETIWYEIKHTYIFLTKNPKRYEEFFMDYNQTDHYKGMKKVYFGVSVENQKQADERIPLLIKARFGTTFISVEPMLEAINIEKYLDKIDWVICGGESGANARALNPSWARSLKEQCQKANVPFFFKQWGGNNKKKSGRLLDGKIYEEFPK